MIKGEFTPLASGEQVVEVTSTGDIKLRRAGPDIVASPNPRRLPATTTELPEVEVRENSVGVGSWSVTVVYRNNTSSERLAKKSLSGPDTYNPSLDLTNRSPGNVTAALEINLANGNTVKQNFTYNVAEHFGNSNSLLSVLEGISGLLPTGETPFKAVVALFSAVFMTAAAVSRTAASSEVAGMIGLGIIAGWAIIGWLPYTIVFAGAVGWVGATGLRRGF